MTKRDFIPPILLKLLSRLNFSRSNGWFGNYASWDAALKQGGDYNALNILEKVKDATFKVKNGEAAYERDSVLFDKIEYDWPVVSSLLWVHARSGYLHVMDFGGSLGSTYFQNRFFLKDLSNTVWNVVEQEHFVKCGIKNFQDAHLRFQYNMETCMKECKINLLILSSVLPYLQDPYGLLERVQNLDITHVLIDKMPLIDGAVDRLTIQKVPASIYRASYPAWFFGASRFYEFIKNHYVIVADFDRNVGANIPSVFKGMLLEKKTSR